MATETNSKRTVIYHAKAMFPPNTDFDALEERTSKYLKDNPKVLLPKYGPQYRKRISSFFAACISALTSIISRAS